MPVTEPLAHHEEFCAKSEHPFQNERNPRVMKLRELRFIEIEGLTPLVIGLPNFLLDEGIETLEALRKGFFQNRLRKERPGHVQQGKPFAVMTGIAHASALHVCVSGTRNMT